MVETGPTFFKDRISAVLPFASAVGIMVSSDMLSMVGRFFGHTGGYGFFLTGLSAFVYLLLTYPYQTLFKHCPQARSDYQLYKNRAGKLSAYIPLMIKTAVLLFLATGLLVSSGFVFNEVFIYWFPNFGFAFILLFFLIFLQILPERIRFNAQILFSVIPITGLLTLIAVGFFISPGPESAATATAFSFKSIEPGIMYMPLLFFIGMDMGFFVFQKQETALKNNLIQVRQTLVFMAALFMLWGITSLHFVPAQKLAGTSISHIIIARSILGDTGRYIMGIIVISGTLAAVNALLMNIQNQVEHICKEQHKNSIKFIPRICVTGLGIVIGLFMAAGLAGHEILETCIHWSLFLWLTFYASIPVLTYLSKIKNIPVKNKGE